MAGMNIKTRIVGSYDTETTNIDKGLSSVAYTILYTYTDVLSVGIRNYDADKNHGNTHMFRRAGEFINYLETFVIPNGRRNHYTPVICVYNMMFDLATILPSLNYRYRVSVVAKSKTQVYLVDCYDKEGGRYPVLRFWDMYFMDTRGLGSLAKTVGISKKDGWDYTKIRTVDTPLTPEEQYYAAYDTYILPAYLKYLMVSNDWLTEDMFGNTVLTKTSLVRVFAKAMLGRLPGASRTITEEFYYNTNNEFPQDYKTYALRKACFKGGLSFTAANYAMEEFSDVASLDVTSMHHTFINGRRVPDKFHPASRRALGIAIKDTLSRSVDDVLAEYQNPFNRCYHVRVAFKNIRLKKDSPFEKFGIGIMARDRFTHKVEPASGDENASASNMEAINGIRMNGYYDQTVDHAVFAFGKLMSSPGVIVYVNEVEMWCLGQVYEWDEMLVMEGEISHNTSLPYAYVSLQSSVLYNIKRDVKRIFKEYDGTPYTGAIPNTIPMYIANGLRSGTLAPEYLESYYRNMVKGQFNSIYGTQAQDPMAPGYLMDDEDCTVKVDKAKVVNEETFASRRPNLVKTQFNYAMRIAAGSRMHLVIAIELLYRAFGDRVLVLGGDTDSLKVACNGVTDSELEEALEPIARASKKAIDACQYMIRRRYPQLASDFEGVGSFDIENRGHHYTKHIELYPKARVSMDDKGHAHLTMAGLPRPVGIYNTEDLINDMVKSGYDFRDVVQAVGYSTISKELTNTHQSLYPKYNEQVDTVVTDYTGHRRRVHQLKAVALYATDRRTGDPSKQEVRDNIKWMIKAGRPFDYGIATTIYLKNGQPVISAGIDEEWVGERS